MNPLIEIIWKFLTFPLWFLQPSYPDPDAWIVLAFYEALWLSFWIVMLIATLFHVTKEK